ncbi:MAG: MBOAT family protein, partial [Coprococcus sp.]
MYGVIIIIEKLVSTLLKKKGKENILCKIPGFVKHIYTMVLVSLGWVLFDTDNLSMAFTYMKRMVSFGSTFADKHTIYLLVNFGLLFVIAIIGCTSITKKLAFKLKNKKPAWANVLSICYMVIIFLLATAYLTDASYNPFLYFNF